MEQIETTSELDSSSELLENLMRPQPTVIGIEGGPCGGKTTLVNRLAETASDRPVVILPEAASQHIAKLAERGLTVPEIAANDRPAFLEFEKDVLATIVGQIEQAKQEYAGTDAIIVADRVDIGAYLTDAEYQQVLAGVGLTRPPMLDLVDHLYYLPSVAVESPEKYDELQATNVARYETAEQAAATCQANLAVVARHPELSVAWGGDFEAKIKHLAESIMHPEAETELALDYFDVAGLASNIRHAYRRGRFLSKFRIEQSYHQLDRQEFRLRAVTTERDEQLYYFTVKTGEGVTRHELQHAIGEEDYKRLLSTPQLGRTLYKTRYEFLKSHDLAGRGLRKWSADYYDDPDLQLWRVEIDLRDESDEEMHPWNELPAGNYLAQVAVARAKNLAML